MSQVVQTQSATTFLDFPFDVLVHLFNVVTRNRDWELRQNLLLASRELNAYSKTNQHLQLIVRLWHQRGCLFLREKLTRPVPTTIAREDVQRAVAIVKEAWAKKTPPLYPHLNAFYSLCPTCSNMVFFCNIM